MTKSIILTESLKKGCLSKDFGTVYRYNNHIYRTIEPAHRTKVRDMVSNNKLMEKLHQKGLVKTTIAPVHTEQHDLILEHELIEFESYTDEWSLPAKLDAAIMSIRLLKELVKNGWCFWDGHEFNILFDYTVPKWIDFHSIIPLAIPITNISWYNEFKFYVFDKLVDDDILWKGELKAVKSKETLAIFLREIELTLSSVQINPQKTPWFDYPRLSDTDLDDKQKSTLQVMEKVKPFCDTFLDIGCNVGWYSKAASRMGYRVVAIDIDEACIAELYADAKTTESKILPLVSDFKTCFDVINTTHQSFADRIQCDVTFSLALLHHLVFFQGITFPFIAERLNALSKKVAIVQFITRDDSYVKHWLKTKTIDWYTTDNFILEMSKHFSRYEIFESSPSGRKLIVFEK